MIKESTDHLDKLLSQAERYAKFAREEVLLAQTCRKKEEHTKI
jgi:hypothetical protein